MAEINENCPCKKRGCERHGHCDECRENHVKKKNPPYCERKRKQ